MKTARQLTLAILFLLIAGAFYGSYHLITDSTGSSIGLPFYLLNGSPIKDYSLPGWLLLFTVGIPASMVVIEIWRKSKRYSFLIMLQGILLSLFIIVQMILFGETFLIQFVFLFLGIALIGLGLLQHQRKIIVEAGRKTMPAPKSHHHKHRKHR
jgi:hypothetical protein